MNNAGRPSRAAELVSSIGLPVFFLLSGLWTSGCATGVSRVKLYDPQSYDKQAKKAGIALAAAPSLPETSDEALRIGIGKVKDSRPDITCIGAKKNTFGTIMGKVDVEENVNFLDIFKTHFFKCVTAAGYDLVPLNDDPRDKSSGAKTPKAAIDADIRSFWVEFMPGFAVVDALSNVVIDVRFVDLQTHREMWSDTFRGKAKVSGMAVTRSMF